MPFTLSTTPFLFNQQEFGDWLCAQGGGLVVINDSEWDTVGINGPFGAVVSGQSTDAIARMVVFQVMVRVAALELEAPFTGAAQSIVVPVGNWWFVGAECRNYIDGSGSASVGFVTAYGVR